MSSDTWDLIIIGGGIVGLSTAREITGRYRRLRVLVVEKEDSVAQHQSGHNSGVIHCGIYYTAGSIKARTCVQGAAEMIQFCREYGIQHEICGKVIVAADVEEIPGLQKLYKQSQDNGIAGVRQICREELLEIEPHCGGQRALHVPGTGITDYGKVSAKYADLVTLQGGEIRTRCKVIGFRKDKNDIVLETKDGVLRSHYIINCAGLQSDYISRLAGVPRQIQIVPFRGEYYDVIPERQFLVRSLIYPVPDPRFPFLGVHFTSRVDGKVDAGPNAVLSFKREGYRRVDFNLRDAVTELRYSGFWQMARKHWRTGLSEYYRSFSKRAFVRALQRLVPDIRSSDLIPGQTGVRAQAVWPDGSFVDDFQFFCSDNMLHVCNVPSPAATASIPIGRTIAQLAKESFGLTND
jgi:L-2-hydroxyglutarate oxidase LhgO